MDLKCRKTTCKYNDHFSCQAKNIEVSSNLSCETFEKDPGKIVRDTSICMFEEAPKYAPHRAKKHMRVACSAKCLFNDQGTCTANGLTVNAIKECPCCMTFLKP